jgi:PAS domain S-box-containing protein
VVPKITDTEVTLREQANLLNLAHDSIFARDMKNVITYWNRGAAEFYGWTAAEVVGKVTTHQLLQTVFPAPLDEIDAELLRTSHWEGELMHTKADGTKAVVASRWSLQRDEQQRPQAVLEVNNDITERKRAEAAIREQANLLNLTHDSIFVRDMQNVITYWNRGAAEFYGWSAAEVVGKVTVHQLLQTVFPAPLDEIDAELLRTSHWEGDLVHTKADGTRAVVASRWSLQRDEQQRPQAILEFNNDVTERKRAETAMREQANLLNLTHDSIFVRDTRNVITYWNHGAEEFYGWTAAAVVGKMTTHQLLQTVFPVPLDEIDAELLRTGRWEGELVHTKADGTKAVVASRWSLQRDERQRPQAVLEVNNDITERKRREDEIRRLSQELAKRASDLEGTNSELETFAYSVSHDLRAPLRHLAGYSELLQTQASSLLDDKSRRYIKIISASVNKMGHLIDDLLAFSRIGRAETEKMLVSLEQLVKEVVAEFGQETKGREIAWKIGALPACYGDRSMLRIVIVNLVSNAVKFTRLRKPAEIEIGCADVNRNEVEVFIRDNGAGFDMRYANKLFGVFQRLHLPDEFEGTGIGLATVQRIIHRHGGKVRAEGAVDRGATLYFSLPKEAAVEWTESTP